MAVFKTANGKGKYHDTESKKQVIRYILDPSKMIHGYYGAFHVDTCNIVESMNEVSRHFGKSDGVQLRHFILSFDYEEVWSYKIVNDIAKKIAYRLGREYQIVYGTKKEHHAMMDVIRDVLKEYCIKELRYISNA